jgi:O-acetyl-ADP-ribose deacetylase (regulator of RNase III)
MNKIYIVDNLLECDGLDVICHSVNCQGVMGSGMAKQVRDKWPEVYNNYKQFVDEIKNKNNGKTYPLLGDVCFVQTAPNGPTVANLFLQNFYGRDGKRYTSYDALCTALEKLKTWCLMNFKEKRELDEPIKIGFPMNMGCALGGGNWTIVETIIDEVFKNNDIDNIIIYICKYDK